jgi:uncharacterized protein YbjT (DUF2867 family)
MKIVVIGGTGLIGSKLVMKLRQLGHEVVAASPASGVNSITGEGWPGGAAGVVVDMTNSPSGGKAVIIFDVEPHLSPPKRPAGHHVALGRRPERLLESGYFRAKLAQEDLIKASGVPYTILRSTQFFEFMGGIAQEATDGKTVRLPSALMQPVVSDDVAAALADITLGAPVNRHGRAGRSRTAPSRRARPAILERKPGRTSGDHGRPRALLRLGVERSISYPGRQPAHRPDAFRGLAQPLHTSHVEARNVRPTEPARTLAFFKE